MAQNQDFAQKYLNISKLSICPESIVIQSSDEIFEKLVKPKNWKDEERGIYIKVGAMSDAKGSAYMEYGNTKIRATIDPPKEITDSRKKLQAKRCGPLALITCTVFYSTFATTDIENISKKEQFLGSALTKALKPAILRHLFPNFELEINVNVLEDDGCVLSTAINCASIAIIHGGIPMYGMLVASTIALYKETYFINPTAEIEQMLETIQPDDKDEKTEYGFVVVSNLEVLKQITQCLSKGFLEEGTLDKLIEMTLEYNKKLKLSIGAPLYQKIKHFVKNNAELFTDNISKPVVAENNVTEDEKKDSIDKN